MVNNNRVERHCFPGYLVIRAVNIEARGQLRRSAMALVYRRTLGIQEHFTGGIANLTSENEIAIKKRRNTQ
jgi:hypothetical protein